MCWAEKGTETRNPVPAVSVGIGEKVPSSLLCGEGVRAEWDVKELCKLG